VGWKLPQDFADLLIEDLADVEELERLRAK
jgi:hypothetical protein